MVTLRFWTFTLTAMTSATYTCCHADVRQSWNAFNLPSPLNKHRLTEVMRGPPLFSSPTLRLVHSQMLSNPRLRIYLLRYLVVCSIISLPTITVAYLNGLPPITFAWFLFACEVMIHHITTWAWYLFLKSSASMSTGLLLGDIFQSCWTWFSSHLKYLVTVHKLHFYSITHKLMPSMVISWSFKAWCGSVVNRHCRDFGSHFICSHDRTVSDMGFSSCMHSSFQGKETPGAIWSVLRVHISTKRIVTSQSFIQKSYLGVCLRVRTWFSVQVNLAN